MAGFESSYGGQISSAYVLHLSKQVTHDTTIGYMVVPKKGRIRAFSSVVTTDTNSAQVVTLKRNGVSIATDFAMTLANAPGAGTCYTATAADGIESANVNAGDKLTVNTDAGGTAGAASFYVLIES